MHVTHIITRLIVGGAQENTISSVLGLRSKPGLTVDLIAGPTTGPEGTLEPTVSVVPGLLTIEPSLVRQVSPWTDLQALLRLTAILRARQPDIVHTHSGKAGILGRLAARRANVPVIVHTIHGPSFGPFQGTLANTVFVTAERIAARATTHFVTVADAMKDQYIAAGIGHPSQYTRVWSGFDLKPFLEAANDLALRENLGISASDFVVGKIARLFKLKGHDDLFEIAPELVRWCPNLRMLFVGDGAWRGRFEQRARETGLEKHFIFTGLVPPTEVGKYVGIMDALVHLSLREGLPRALPQALAAGKPVIAYDCDGAREVCIDGHTGFLVQPGDRKTLLERITALSNDSALAARLGMAGQKIVRQQFSVEQMVDALHSLYVKLLNP